MSKTDPDDSSYLNLSPYFAVACGMVPCRKTFGANITYAVYQEAELSSDNIVLTHDHAGHTLATNETLRDGSWQSCTPTPQNTSANTLQINMTSMTLMSEVSGDGVRYTAAVVIPDINTTAALWYPNDCVWRFGTNPADAISAFVIVDDFFDNKTLTAPYWSRDPSSARGDLWLVNLYRNGTATMDTVAAYMDGLAWSVTANLRQNSADPVQLRVASGQMQAAESCLAVRWAWLSLPAALLGLEVAFLAAIVVLTRSSKHWRGDWKDSSLALLFHGLDDDYASRSREKEKGVAGDGLRGRDGMFEVAKGMKVQLTKGEGDWRFCEVGYDL